MYGTGCICTINGVDYYKTNPGKALAGTFDYSLPSGCWTGPILVSTDISAVTYTVNGVSWDYGESFEYLGITWYVSSDLDFQRGDSEGLTGVHSFNKLDGHYYDLRDAAIELIDVAGVTVS